MSEAILKALMQLFALIVDIDEVQEISDKEREIIRAFLSRQLNQELVERYMNIFEEYLVLYHEESIDKGSIKERKRTALKAVRILGICEKINEELEQTQKIYVIIQLIEYIAYGIEIRDTELDFLETVASAFNIPDQEYRNILNYVIYSIQEIPQKENVLLINNEKESGIEGVNHEYVKNLTGEISFLNIHSINMYVLRYHGRDDLFLNGQHIQTGLTYTFVHGSSIRGQNIDPIYYTDVAGTFSTLSIDTKLCFIARDVEFRFRNSENGLQEFNLQEESGKLVGIMGGSGVGKSTLLSVLNGNLKPQKGEILINGYNLYHEKEKEKLKGVIGFVPQDDLLIEDLTVYQNLYYNAKLCMNDYNEEQIRDIVDQVLFDLDLYEVRNLKVGKPLSKVISGGQRKRVNIGLELIREPSVLFVDEPTSGLSSVDSEMVMNLLKEQVFKGKLVIVNIHQPSSYLYKMFDRIIFLDKGGYPIFSGNPSEAVIYFKTKSNHANAKEDQCITCGNVDPDQVLQIIESKIVNEHGKLSRTRKVSPREWFSYFKESGLQKSIDRPEKSSLPENYFSIPKRINQSRIFFIRDIRSKLTNRQYVVMILTFAPLLALILGYLTKYFHGPFDNPEAYIFRNNENIVYYLFLSVLVFMFLGMNISSSEIFKDRTILKRESFLNLSRFSYLNSKILIMFMISAIQTLAYVLIGNLILEIRGMTFTYWLILFSTACFANLLGLNISSGFNSIVTIYIVIPLLLIPEILLSGATVKFDKIHKNLTNSEYVPIIGDLMTTRWAFEALTVEQYKSNRYQKPYFDLEQEISNNKYYVTLLIPTLETKVYEAENYLYDTSKRNELEQYLSLLKDQITYLTTQFPDESYASLGQIDIRSFSETSAEEIINYLKVLKEYLRGKMLEAESEKRQLEDQISQQAGGLNAYQALKNNYENKKLTDIVLDKTLSSDILELDNRLIRKYEPVYMVPTSNLGRAHLFAPCKRLGNLTVNTLWFNVIFIWFTTLLLYFTLYFDVLRRLLTRFENIKLRKSG